MRRLPRDRPRIYVDFNEMLDKDLVLLAPKYSRTNSSGQEIHFREGMPVHIFSDDVEPHDSVLIADGKVERNVDAGWSAHVRWCCRIDAAGIREESRDG